MARLHAFISIVLLLAFVVISQSGCSSIPGLPGNKIPEQPATKSASSTGLSTANQALFIHVGNAMKAGQYKQAVTGLKTIISSQPGLAMPYINLAISYRHLNELKNAQASIRQALRNAADSPEAYNVQGIIQREAGQFKESRKSYERAIKLDNKLADSHLNLAILCDLYLQDLNCALSSYENYKAAAGSDDKRLKGWIADLKRRIKKGRS